MEVVIVQGTILKSLFKSVSLKKTKDLPVDGTNFVVSLSIYINIYKERGRAIYIERERHDPVRQSCTVLLE